VLPVRLPEPARPGLGPGHRWLRRRPVRLRRRRRRPVLGVLHLQHHRQPDRHHRHHPRRGGDHHCRHLPDRRHRPPARHHRPSRHDVRGTTSTSYGYDAAGNLTSVTGASQDQALTWNDNGQLSQDAVTPAGGTAQDTSYIYDANGNLLLAADPGTTTLYLSDGELSLNTSTDTVTGTRYYTLGNSTIATLTGASTVAYVVGDQQGTDSLAISSSTLDLTRRYYDPYGNTRGAPAANFPTGEKGFIGGTGDPATGLTDLCAREYQPQTGSFITTDPLLKPLRPARPQRLHVRHRQSHHLLRPHRPVRQLRRGHLPRPDHAGHRRRREPAEHVQR